ncbi:MAG: hypothetical protein JXX14_22230 [Deltaproteobacteria bacterium]|nr:hypothetical protein [Deltaproteobacteria bacterium]
MENSKKKVFSHKTQFTDGDYHCAEVSVKLFETYGDELLLQIREGRSACVGADSGSDSFDTRVFRLVNGKTPVLVSLVRESSSYMGKASGSADGSEFQEEWELPVQGGVLVRRETKSSDSEDWRSEADEDAAVDSESPLCAEGEILQLRTTSYSLYHAVDWMLRISGPGVIPLGSIEVAPEQSDSSEELYCGQQWW